MYFLALLISIFQLMKIKIKSDWKGYNYVLKIGLCLFFQNDKVCYPCMHNSGSKQKLL